MLLVEDERSIADTVCYALKTEGFDTIWARSGSEARASMERGTFDAIILDIGLPDRDGLDLCREIRTRSNVPVIFLTACAHEIDRIVGLEIGADDYLTKPFSPRELTTRLRALFRRIRRTDDPDVRSKGRGSFVVDNEGCRIRMGESWLDGLAAETAVAARLMGVPMTTLRTTSARPGDVVMVTGLGPVGHLAALVFMASGYRVVGVDPEERRRQAADQSGLDRVLEAVPVDDPNLKGMVALQLECSGNEAAAADGCHVVKKRGEIVQIGTPWVKETDRSAYEIMHAVFHNYVVIRSGWEWELPVTPEDFRPGSILQNFQTAMGLAGQRPCEGGGPVLNFRSRTGSRGLPEPDAPARGRTVDGVQVEVKREK